MFGLGLVMGINTTASGPSSPTIFLKRLTGLDILTMSTMSLKTVLDGL